MEITNLEFYVTLARLLESPPVIDKSSSVTKQMTVGVTYSMLKKVIDVLRQHPDLNGAVDELPPSTIRTILDHIAGVSFDSVARSITFSEPLIIVPTSVTQRRIELDLDEAYHDRILKNAYTYVTPEERRTHPYTPSGLLCINLTSPDTVLLAHKHEESYWYNPVYSVFREQSKALQPLGEDQVDNQPKYIPLNCVGYMYNTIHDKWETVRCTKAVDGNFYLSSGVDPKYGSVLPGAIFCAQTHNPTCAICRGNGLFYCKTDSRNYKCSCMTMKRRT